MALFNMATSSTLGGTSFPDCSEEGGDGGRPWGGGDGSLVKERFLVFREAEARMVPVPVGNFAFFLVLLVAGEPFFKERLEREGDEAGEEVSLAEGGEGDEAGFEWIMRSLEVGFGGS